MGNSVAESVWLNMCNITVLCFVFAERKDQKSDRERPRHGAEKTGANKVYKTRCGMISAATVACEQYHCYSNYK